jgi:hypothetical protein
MLQVLRVPFVDQSEMILLIVLPNTKSVYCTLRTSAGEMAAFHSGKHTFGVILGGIKSARAAKQREKLLLCPSHLVLRLDNMRGSSLFLGLVDAELLVTTRILVLLKY